MVTDKLKERNLPPFMGREEMLDVLLREEYGYLPPPPEKITWEVKEDIIPNFCAGKAVLNRVTISVRVNGKEFGFPIYAAIPTAKKKHPFFVHINFRDNVPDRYMPTEEITDHGFAVLSFCYRDVTADNPDFQDGLAGALYPDGKRDDTSAGKIAMWAWAAQRVMDYAQTLNCLDLKRSIVCGHSRLGKTALLAAATDERFSCAFSNDSGCGGAAITRGKRGETIENICGSFPYWFCETYKMHANNEPFMPFDQHFLLASVAPRSVYVSSAEEDIWADPESEFLCCVAAGEVFGEKGFVHNDTLPAAGDVYHSGSIGYHLRAGKHYFSREDWLLFIAFFNGKGEK